MAKTVKRPIKTKAAPHCPYCNVELMAKNSPMCQACQVTISYCTECGKPLSRNQKTCTTCGTRVIS